MSDERKENFIVRGWRNVREAGPRRLALTGLLVLVALAIARFGWVIPGVADAERAMFDFRAFVEADRDFHVALLMAADNEYLAAICTAIAAALTVSLHRTNPTARSNRASLPAHERIVVALRKRDGEAAASESRRQLDEAMKRLRASVKTQ